MGPAARRNDRACGWRRWRKQEESDYFWPGRTQLARAPARLGQASRPPALRPFPVSWRGGEKCRLAGSGGGAGPWTHPHGLFPPQSSRVPAPACAWDPKSLGCCSRESRRVPSAAAPTGMDSGRDFLTLHGECPARSGDPRESLSLSGDRGSSSFCCICTTRQTNALASCGISENFSSGWAQPWAFPDFSPSLAQEIGEQCRLLLGVPLILFIKGRAPRSRWHRRSRGRKRAASLDHRVLPAPSEVSQNTGVPGPRQAARAWQMWV